ncbi:hypothetical protein MIMGU_mgv1a009385mg [Erythranthe guttata]|uniref:Uncharacterized protein n=1 Tax=Erythranthe guttata TaxID=4155 RepID=A0A022Q0E0_ERYGU|nr:hypothetical protein MIMGU_mgv1a009385mg [Erythranthe guttata]
MAESVEGEGFWLPAEFLTDDDFLPGKENLNKSFNTESLSELRFPTEFPYDFESERKQIPEVGVRHFGLPFNVFFFLNFIYYFLNLFVFVPLFFVQKLWLMSTSPQSTLTRMGSWTARSAGGSSNVSPNSSTPAPKTQFAAKKYDVVGDLVYHAAGQVMKLKLNHGDVLGGLQPTRVPPRSRPQFYPDSENPSPPVFPHRNFQQQNECCGEWYSQQRVYQNRGVRNLSGAGQTAWTIQQNPTRVRAISFVGGGGGGGGAAARRGSAGTGVFLPRRYGNNNNNNNNDSSSSDSHMTTGCSTPLFHGRPSANSFAQSRVQQPQPRIAGGFIPNYSMFIGISLIANHV